MLYDPRISEARPTVVDRKKRCVYCGMTFNVHANQVDSNIVKVGRTLTPNMPLF